MGALPARAAAVKLSLGGTLPLLGDGAGGLRVRVNFFPGPPPGTAAGAPVAVRFKEEVKGGGGLGVVVEGEEEEEEEEVVDLSADRVDGGGGGRGESGEVNDDEGGGGGGGAALKDREEAEVDSPPLLERERMLLPAPRLLLRNALFRAISVARGIPRSGPNPP